MTFLQPFLVLGPRADRVIAGAVIPPVALWMVLILTCLARYWTTEGFPKTRAKTRSRINWSRILTALRMAHFMFVGCFRRVYCMEVAEICLA